MTSDHHHTVSHFSQERLPDALVLAIGLVLILVYLLASQVQQGHFAELIQQEQIQALDQRERNFERPILSVLHDLKAVKKLIQGESAPEDKIALVLEEIILTQPYVFQVRRIDLQGIEQFRIDRRHEDDLDYVTQLQDKSERNYVKDLLALPEGAFYLSDFDLNIENGEIERPFRPTVRIGIRLSNALGMLVVNLDVTDLFNSATQDESLPFDKWLVNQHGDWLFGPNPARNWGFVFGQPHKITEYFNSVQAAAVLNQEHSLMVNNDGSFTISSKMILADSFALNNRLEIKDPLILVDRYPAEFITERSGRMQVIPPSLITAIIGTVTLIMLITVRKLSALKSIQVEVRASRESMERLKGITEILPQLTWTCNARGECDYISKSWENYTGARNEALIGAGWLDFVHPDDKTQLVKSWNHSVTTGADFNVLFRILDKAGNYHTFDTRARALKDSEGNVVQWFGSNTDIQERIDYQEYLEESRKRLRDKLAQSDADKELLLERLQLATHVAEIGIWEMDIATQRLNWDDQMYQLYGMETGTGEETALTWYNHIHPDDAAITQMQLLKSIESGEDFEWEFRVVHQQDNVRWLRVDASIICDANHRPNKIVGTTLDITTSKRQKAVLQEAKEQAEASNRAKSAFLANMSHEIRTPMNGILGMISLLMDTELNDRQNTYATNAYQASKRLLTILNDILDISGIESGKFSLIPSDFYVDSLIQESIDIFASNAEEKQIDLSISLSPHVPRKLHADSLRIGQVIANLVGNAIKFTPNEGKVNVEFLFESTDGNHLNLVVNVSDTGIGLSDKQMQKIFLPFTQADNTTTRRYGGTGLGLSICERLVTIMGGKIEVQSAPGEGSVFSATFPVELPIEDMANTSINLSQIQFVVMSPSGELIAALTPYAAQWKLPVITVTNCADIVQSNTIDADHPDTVLFIDWVNSPATSAQERQNNLLVVHNYFRIPPRVLLYTSATASIKLRNEINDPNIELIQKPLNPHRLYNKLTFKDELRESKKVSTNLPSQYSHLSVLSVDDVDLNNDVVEGLLEKIGIHPVRANSAEQAIELVKARAFDIILMDVHMEGMTGLDGTRQIRAMKNVHQPLIVGLSASVMEEDRMTGLASGMDHYLMKPFQLAEFLQILEQRDLTKPTDHRESASVNIDTQIKRFNLDVPKFIDQQQAYSTLSGNQTLFERCLTLFIQNFGQFDTELMAAHSANNRDLVQQLSHKLKGSAIYIGDVQLSELAASTEAQCKQGILPDAAPLARRLKQHRDALANSLFISEQQNSNAGAGFMQEDISALIKDIAERLKQNRIVPPDQLQKLFAGLKQQGQEASANQIQQALARFDFAAASAALNKVIDT